MSGSVRRAARRKLVKRYLAAVAIQQAVVRHTSRQRPARIPNEPLQTWHRLRRQESLAISRGFELAAAQVREQSLRVLTEIRDSIERSLDELAAPASHPFRCSLAEIFHDLTALEAEYGKVHFNRRSQSFSVTTGPIELEGVALGRFEIVLELRYLGQSHPYRVVAKDPQAAAACDSTTHPHVQSETLCEGEGQRAIKQALVEGRIYDFFQIVDQILQTYNRHSAYISLGDWSGVECCDCGARVDEDESISCYRCEDPTCNECSHCCEGCHESCCDSCTVSCEGCDTRYCKDCLASCHACEKPFCQHCLTENRCDDCHQNQPEATETSAETESEVHPLCVGQAEVSA